MILSGPTIKRLGIIEPHYPKTRLNGVSYGESGAGYDIRTADTINLVTGKTRLAVTVEKFRLPNNVLGIVHDKSTWARLGIQVQNTVLEPGWFGYLTLELSYASINGVADFYTIPANTGIAQVVFHFTDAPTTPYEGKYQDQAARPVGAIMDT